MTAPARFMFDTVFPGRHTAQDNHASVPKFTDADIKATRETAYQEGLAAGRQDVADDISRLIDQKLETLLSHMQTLEQQMPGEIEKISAMAVDLAFTASRTLASELTSKQPHAELEQMFSDCVSQLSEAPHLVIRVPDTDLEALRTRMETIAQAKGYDGNLVLLAEDGMHAGDCQIEWADGGISRSRDQLETNIRTLIANHYRGTLPNQPENNVNESVAPEPAQIAPEGPVE